ncbi:YceD family protein [Desulfovermiculus halophilus]|uniref:YceD family protein n=1 Tax=Desulfovermiculus halophilus TaxID=339722 RepID=UPI000486D70D|nr:DUF177 domain-containing protein [Desulfovermiculus halophilus]
MHIWVSFAECPAQGRRLTISEQAVWSEPLAEFELNAEIVEPLTAELHIVPQSDGLLIQGRLQGSVSLVCDRCTESMPCPLDVPFTVFESLEGQNEEEEYAERFRQGGEGLELDLAAVLWEQFVLALPVKPLCMPNCRGICPQCGRNLNAGECGCDRNTLDPRLEVLRRLQINTS